MWSPAKDTHTQAGTQNAIKKTLIYMWYRKKQRENKKTKNQRKM